MRSRWKNVGDNVRLVAIKVERKQRNGVVQWVGECNGCGWCFYEHELRVVLRHAKDHISECCHPFRGYMPSDGEMFEHWLIGFK